MRIARPDHSPPPAARSRIDPALRRAYDLRGVVGRTLGPDDAHGVGRAFADIARQAGASRLAVSRDGRLSSPLLESELVRGLCEGGMHVLRMPLGPTPLVSFAIDRLGLDGGIMVTGSHNPADQNGFKLRLGNDPFHGESLARLWQVEGGEHRGGTLETIDPSDAYVDALADELRGLAVPAAAWDCGNGATGPIVERLLPRLGGAQRAVFAAVDGRFPNHHPDPSVAENLEPLADIVARDRLDLGIAFDGDGDRIGLVDGTGEIVWADQLMLLLSREVLEARPGSAIVADVKCSQSLFSGIASLGGRAVMSPSGYVLVRERMLREGASLAGEMSGHIFFADRWHAADDALYVAVRALRVLARLGLSLREFRERLPPTFATPELRLSCPDDRKDQVIASLLATLERAGTKVDRTDGLRVVDGDGWWLLRASGTEAKLTARCEAGDAAALRRITSYLAEALRRAGVEPVGLDAG
jgi:phosphomannomutase